MSETWIVGINPVEGALANDPSRVREILVEQGTHNPRITALADEARRLGVRVHARPRAMLDKVSSHARHQGIAANYEVLGRSPSTILPICLKPTMHCSWYWTASPTRTTSVPVCAARRRRARPR